MLVGKQSCGPRRSRRRAQVTYKYLGPLNASTTALLADCKPLDEVRARVNPIVRTRPVLL